MTHCLEAREAMGGVDGSWGKWGSCCRGDGPSRGEEAWAAELLSGGTEWQKNIMDWAFVHKIWEKFISSNVGSGQPLKAALLINYDPSGPSRLMSTIAEQDDRDLFHWTNQYLVTSIHESWFCARCMSTSKPAGEGAILMHTGAFLLIGLYDGSIGSASRAMVVLDQFAWQLSRRNH
ncbi:hypothetical protein HAX54_036488 [Datura stramonium]|uniref:Profilin n=1 Tax=Datura stramonium TaxID=4076 RepID=A0ABS8SGG0_DATST|nr:hypothetical protein [Datura stramonium]